jgi:O-methyltransferase
MHKPLRVLNRSLRQCGFEVFRADPGSLGYGTSRSKTLRNSVLRALATRGYGVRPTYDMDVPPEVREIVDRVRPYTMTSNRSVVGLCEAVEYVVRNEIGGPFVECGVWRGGSVMAEALTLLHLGVTDRDLYLFDTFAGMPMPHADDVSLREPGQRTLDHWRSYQRADHNDWAYASIDAVRENILSTGYPADRVHLVRGLVEETIPELAPGSIALLRLDTDWYSSTRHELEHLYPRLVAGGVLIVDDYGAWAGARKAVDEYAPARGLFLGRLDGIARVAIKPGEVRAGHPPAVPCRGVESAFEAS